MPDASESASATIRATLEGLVQNAVEMQWRTWPGLRESFSEEQLRNTVQDTRYHLQFLASALWAHEPLLFSEYLVWAKVLFTNLGLPLEWLSGSLACVQSALAEALPQAEAVAAAACIQSGLNALETASVDVPPFIKPDQPLGTLAMRYHGAVLGGDRHGASRAVLEAVESGTPIKDIYLWVFQQSQSELGRLWELNRISVAQEHYATAVTQMVMSQLYAYVFTAKRIGRTLVAACVGEELHELGVRMVADFFEMEGWDTHYLGAATPTASIVGQVRERGADLLLLSATMSYRVGAVAEIVSALRTDEQTRTTKVLVGGYPFNLAPELWRRVGADGYAPDAGAALEVGGQLMAA